jgi:hypothetical protein
VKIITSAKDETDIYFLIKLWTFSLAVFSSGD